MSAFGVPEADIRAGLQHLCFVPKNLYGAIDVKCLSWMISSPCSIRRRPSPRPDPTFRRLLRAATVKGGRRPSRSDLPLTVASTAAGFLDRRRPGG